MVPGESPFAEAFGRLVQQLRSGPDDRDTVRELLTKVSVHVARQPATEEAGIQLSGMLNEISLRGRMHARGVDTIRVAAGAPAEELLRLAEALAQEGGALPSTDLVQVSLVEPIHPGAEDGIQLSDTTEGDDPEPAPDPSFQFVPMQQDDSPRSPRLAGGIAREIEGLSAAITSACEQSAWLEAIHATQALVKMGDRFPDPERRSFGLRVKRLLPKSVLASFIEFAVRVPEERHRVVEVLPWGGRDAIEAMVESIQQTDTVEARRFLHDAIVATPGAISQVLPMLQHQKASVVRHAAELLARLGDQTALQPLLAKCEDPDDEARAAALHALAAFGDPRAVEALRQGLQHDSPMTRGEAALAIAASRRTALGMPLVVALEQERDDAAWTMMARALGQIGSHEAVTALTTVALEKKGFLKRGQSRARRLEAVRILADCRAATARGALEGLCRVADGDGAAAARRAHLALGKGLPQTPTA
jgi:hypothetical protein